MISYSDLPKKIVQTVFECGAVNIDMTVNTQTGKVTFEGYINGEFVAYSGAADIITTARRVNDELTKSNL